MFFDILKRDLKRKKTMNFIILLFVILSVMFISSSVTNLTAVIGSLDSFFDKAGVGDYTAAAIMSAAVNAAQTGAIDGCKFKCSRDYVENTITVTKLPNDDEREA